jgi:hypothetical protein
MTSWTGSIETYRQHIAVERERRRRSRRSAAPKPWQPYPGGPQEAAYRSEADILGYGGEAGGGKSDLLLGTAGEHHRAVIFRREFPRLSALIDRSREIFNREGVGAAKDSYNESLHRWKRAPDRVLQFAAMQYEDDKFNYQGRPNDFYGFDEVTEFFESQVRFVIGWNRSTHIDPETGKPQRCRVIMTFNPPMTAEGEWVIAFFLPWLAYLKPEHYQHPRPAKPGELRWYATVAGKDEEIPERDLRWFVETADGAREVPSGDTFQDDAGTWQVPIRGVLRDGELVYCRSRTFIPAALKDNPILRATGYAATIDAMPEPYRSLLKGQWGAGQVENPWQLIPSAWVRAANARWKPHPSAALSSVGADIARGGADRMSIAKLHGNWLAPLETHAGAVITNGPKAAALLLRYRAVPLGVDIIGIGSSAYDSLDGVADHLLGINFGEGAPEHLTSRDGKLRFVNVRAAAYWKVREALDPDHGDMLALPDDPELRQELTAPRFEVTARGIKIEPKDAIKERIGRSPDKADAFVLAYYVRIATPPKKTIPPRPPTVSYRS